MEKGRLEIPAPLFDVRFSLINPPAVQVVGVPYSLDISKKEEVKVRARKLEMEVESKKATGASRTVGEGERPFKGSSACRANGVMLH